MRGGVTSPLPKISFSFKLKKLMDVIHGDLLDLAELGQFDVIVHGCNCFHAMRSGIARQIALRYPNVEQADYDTERGDKGKLGSYSYATVKGKTGADFIVVNAYTQYKWSGSKDVFEYKAFDEFLNRLCGMLYAIHERKEGVINAGFPEIGCGLAKGNKKKIYSSIERFAKDCHPWASTKIVVFSNTGLDNTSLQ